MNCKDKEQIKKVNLCGKSQKLQNEIIWKRHVGVSGRLLTTRSQMGWNIEVQRTRIWCSQIRSWAYSCHACYNRKIKVPSATGFDTSRFPTVAMLHMEIILKLSKRWQVRSNQGYMHHCMMINSEEPCGKSSTFQWRLQCWYLRKRRKMLFNPSVIMSIQTLPTDWIRSHLFWPHEGERKALLRDSFLWLVITTVGSQTDGRAVLHYDHQNFRWSNCCHFPIQGKARSLALRIPTSWDLKRGSWMCFAPLSIKWLNI